MSILNPVNDDTVCKSGTTIVGLVGRDYAILASDKQGTLGNLAYDLDTQKLYSLNKNNYVGLAGTLGDAQKVIRVMNAEIKLYETERNKTMSTKAIATFLSNYLNSNRYYPYFAGFVLVGYDTAPHLFGTDSIGGFGEHREFSAIGSGSTFAIGVLDKGYDKEMSKEDAITLVSDSIKSSRKRDIYSGGTTIDIIVFTKDKVELLKL